MIRQSITSVGLWALALCLLVCGNAKADALKDFVLFGVDGTTANLAKHDFATGGTTVIGPVADGTGKRFYGIEGMAHIPGHVNLMAFWPDASGDTRLIYVNSQTARGTVVGQSLGKGVVQGGVAVKSTANGRYYVYAVQEVEQTEDKPIDFTITSGSVVPSQTFAAKVSVLGAAISAGGSYDMPVSLKVTVGGTDTQPFGAFTDPITGDVNDDKNARHHIYPTRYPANTTITVTGTSWIKKSNSYIGNEADDWKVYRTRSSSAQSSYVKVLRDGDPVPNITPFLNQGSIVSFVKDYVDSVTNRITLDENQAIYLFELGTDDVNSAAADFQDLVVLVTLAENPEDLEDHDNEGGSHVTGAIMINPNNNDDYEFLLTKTSGEIDRDDLLAKPAVDEKGVFYDGAATQVRVKPKGGGEQNTLIVNGRTLALENNVGYTITGDMTVALRTDKINGDGTAMGQWLISIDAKDVVIEDEDGNRLGGSVSRLIKVNHVTGGVEQTMMLSRVYNGLAATTDQVFYATHGEDLYRIDVATQTETLVGTLPMKDNRCLEFADNRLLDFSTDSARLFEANTTDATMIGTARNVGISDLRSIIVIKKVNLPRPAIVGYD